MLDIAENGLSRLRIIYKPRKEGRMESDQPRHAWREQLERSDEDFAARLWDD